MTKVGVYCDNKNIYLVDWEFVSLGVGEFVVWEFDGSLAGVW